MGCLRLASGAENLWVGLAVEQDIDGVNETAANYLGYEVAFLSWSGADHVDFAGAVVEVDVQ